MSYQPGYDPTRPQPPISAVPAGLYPPIQYQPLPPQMVVQAAPSSDLATASMVLGILGFLGGWCLFGLPCVLAVILGHIGLHETRDGRKSGRGMAVTGLILGYVFVGPMIALTVLVFFGGVIGAATPTPTSTP
ncbi:DUF4190 domain-containing protein [Micromonospora sp. NPDC005413]|uniref:DUF4190 domain-containing protein n=1 Tax=Micromonospora sp. NPDC005413 TaxID=3154563 RepID=UPI0033BB2ECF